MHFGLWRYTTKTCQWSTVECILQNVIVETETRIEHNTLYTPKGRMSLKKIIVLKRPTNLLCIAWEKQIPSTCNVRAFLHIVHNYGTVLCTVTCVCFVWRVTKFILCRLIRTVRLNASSPWRKTNPCPHTLKWKEVPAAQVSCGPAFTHTELKPTWLSTSSNHWGGGASAKYGGAIRQVWGGSSAKYGGGHQPTMRGGHQPSMGGSSTNYGGGHQPSMGGVINQLWGGPSAKYGGGVFSHQYVQEVKIQRITLATHTSCRL